MSIKLVTLSLFLSFIIPSGYNLNDTVFNENPKNHFKDIFNGKNLKGWKVYGWEEDVQKNYWNVDEGSIVCNTVGNKDHKAVWLFYEKELENFELKLKFQTQRNLSGNSGIQIRSRYNTKNHDMNGPQIDIHPPNPFRTGLLYDESDGYNRWLFPNMPNSAISKDKVNHNAPFYYADDQLNWNELHIICNGTNIKTILNGVTVTNFNGKGILDDTTHQEQKVGMKGKIALQVHAGSELLMRFKDIQLKKL